MSNIENTNYQLPPKIIADLIDADPVPAITLHTKSRKILFLHRANLPGIEEVAMPELRLGGLRINPRTNGPSRTAYYNNIFIQKGEQRIRVKGIPAKARIKDVTWSPDGKQIAFTVTRANGIELWAAGGEPFTARKLTGAIVNATIGSLPYTWLSDNNTLICKTIPKGRGKTPESAAVPAGPIIQENTERKTAHRTYQDLLQNQHDEALFEYYTNSQLIRINLKTGNIRNIGKPGIHSSFASSPDGKYLRVTTIKRPFSYVVPYARFSQNTEIWTSLGRKVRSLAEIPVADDIPNGFEAVRKGPRSFQWRNDQPATLYWVEAQDDGDPTKEVKYRDTAFCLKAPFDSKPQKSISTQHRFGGFQWGDGDLALVYEWRWQDRREITTAFSPDASRKAKKIIFDRSWEDRYHSPGQFQSHQNEYGRSVLLRNESGKLFLIGEGASPEGNRPFVDIFNPKKGKTKRLWQSQAPHYEAPMRILNPDSLQILISRESKTEPANYFIKTLSDDTERPISDYPHPYPHLKDLSFELLKYKRKDGVKLTAKLYLPIGYKKKKHGPLPVLMWAYPREYKSADAAGQVQDSPYRFTRLHAHSPLYWVTQGYAVLEGFGMPVIGEGEQQPNEQFLTQIKANAKAAVKKIVKMGIADPKRIAVGGHSYGAFMTANLLAHTKLFAAGIARSGAYNRTLTPFGFQSEERTFWEATETYMTMSPFAHAHTIDAPLLLIHGKADNNPGTYPMQSERFYNALKGIGKTVRLVMLPHESHGYQARESVMHMLREMTDWLEKYVKNRK